jgi:hypothetical protein
MQSCDIEKRVMKRQEAFNNIGREWLKLNPCNNDSSFIYLPGKVDSVPVEVFITDIDSTYFNKVVDSFTSTLNGSYYTCSTKVISSFADGYKAAETKWKRSISKVKVPKRVVDTIKITVADLQKIKLLESDLAVKTQRLSESNLLAEKTKSKSAQWFWLFIVSCLLLLISVYLNISKK